MEIQRAEAIIEAVLFTLGDPVPLEKLAEAAGHDEDTTRKLLHLMADRYKEEDRGLQLIEVNGSWQLCTKKEMYEYLIRITTVPRKTALTDVQLEVLAIVAYRQPITRLEIEKIRGVKSDHAINRLIELELIEEAGRKDAPGRPILFATTEQFYRRFGIGSMDEIPVPGIDDLEDFREEAQLEIGVRVDV